MSQNGLFDRFCNSNCIVLVSFDIHIVGTVPTVVELMVLSSVVELKPVGTGTFGQFGSGSGIIVPVSDLTFRQEYRMIFANDAIRL